MNLVEEAIHRSALAAITTRMSDTGVSSDIPVAHFSPEEFKRRLHERGFRIIPLTDPDISTFLEWIADRMVNVYGESPNVDFVLRLRLNAETLK